MKRYTIAILAGVAAVAALMQWSSCGGGGSATPDPAVPTIPTIISVTGISSGTTTSATIAATGTTGISVLATNPLTITFSTAMDTATITTSTIGLSCGGTAQTITIANTNSPTNTIFTVTPSADLTQVTDCTLTIGTGVQSSDGGALEAEAPYAYTTGCTVDDTFVTDTLTGGCWAPYSGNIGTQTITAGKMVITPTSGVVGAALEYKTFTRTGNITAIVSIPTFSGLIRSPGGQLSNCALNLMNAVSEDGSIVNVQVSQTENGGSGELRVYVYDDASLAAGNAIIANSGSSSADVSGTLFLKIVQVGATTYNAFYKLSGSDYIQLGGDIPVGTAMGSSPLIGLFAGNNATDESVSCSFADFSVTGATVTGQD